MPKYYPLTAAQRLHLFRLSQCQKLQMLNIGVSLTFQYEFDIPVLKTAIVQAYQRCESMQLRFTKDALDNVLQYIEAKEHPDISFYDFKNTSPDEAKAVMRQWTQVPLALFDAPMSRAVMIALPDGWQGVYLVVNHLVMDGQSVFVFLRDIAELYFSLTGQLKFTPVPMASYTRQLEKDLEYEAGSHAQQVDRAFFEALISNSPSPFDAFKSGKSYLLRNCIENSFTNSNSLLLSLSCFDSQKMKDFCIREGISVLHLILMGLHTYYQKEMRQDDISIVTLVSRRSKLAERRCGGTRMHSYPLRTVISPECTFRDGLFMIRKMLTRMYRHINYDPVEYYRVRSHAYHISESMALEPIHVTYQPVMLKQRELAALGNLQIQTAWYPNGAASQPLYLTVSHRLSDNGLDFNFEYWTSVFCPKDITGMFQMLRKILLIGITDPDSTVENIISL